MSLNVLPSNNLLKLVFLFILAGVSAACTTTQPLPAVDNPDEVWQQRQAELGAIKYWRLRGRIAVSQGVAAWNLSLEWQQKDEDYQIVIHGPFGAGKVKLLGNKDGVLLKDSDEQTFYADNPEDLLFEQTGVHMPVEGLRYWVLGLIGSQQIKPPKLDDQGRLAYLEDKNWKVNFKRYTSVSGMNLPRKIFIKNPDEDIDVRLVVDNWTLGAF